MRVLHMWPGRSDELDKAWDMHVAGAKDTEYSDFFRTLEELRSTPEPETGFVDRLDRNLNMDSIKIGEHSANPWKPALVIPRPSNHGRDFKSTLWLTALGAAALAALILGYAWFGGGNNSQPTTVPAAVVMATPSPEPSVSSVTLFAMTFPEDQLPPAGSIAGGVGYDRIPAGNSSTWEPYCCSGPMVDYILSGEYTIEATSPIQVVRADGQVEEIAANTEVIAGPGDSVISTLEMVFTASAGDQEDVYLLNFTILADTPDASQFHGHLLPGWIGLDADVQGIERLSGEAVVRVDRVILPPGSRLEPPAGDYYFVTKLPVSTLGTPQATAGYYRVDDGPVENNSTDQEFEIYVVAFDQETSATPESS